MQILQNISSAKSRSRFLIGITSFLLVLTLSLPAYAGWILTGRYIDTDGRVLPQRFFIEHNKFKYEMHDFIYIFDFNNQSLILIDISRLTYCKTTLDAYLAYKRDLMTQRLTELMKSIPEGERSAYREEYMHKVADAGKIPPPTTDSVTISDTKIDFRMMNYDTDKYTVSLNGLRVEDVWIAPALKMNDDFSWDRYFDFMAALSLREGDLNLMTSEIYRKLLSTGYPLRRIMYTSIGNNEWQVNKLEEKNIPDYEFYTPDKCKSVTLQQWFAKTAEKTTRYDDYE